MDITLSTYDFKAIMQRQAALGASIALQSVGKISPLMTKQEAYRLNNNNRVAVDRALSKGALKTSKKGGKTSTIYIIRESFNAWILEDELASLPITTKK